MSYILKSFQDRTAKGIIEQDGVAVFLDPGLGKTLTVLHALEQLKSQGYKTFLLGPIRVIETVWEQEAKKFDIDLSFSLIRGTPDERTSKLNLNKDIYMINFEQLVWLFDQDWKKNKGNKLILVVDESTFLKSSKAKRWKALKKQLKHFKKRIILTGTPIPNTYIDLWTQIGILDFGKRLETAFTRFKNKYFYSDYMGFKWDLKQGSDETISNLIEDLVFRVSDEDKVDKNEVFEISRPVMLTTKEMETYKRLEKDSILKIAEEDITALSAASLHGKLSQLANGFLYDEEKVAHDIHEAKWETISDLVEELNGKPCIIVYKFRHEIVKLKQYFGKDVVVLNEGDAVSIIEDWNKGKIKILAIHPKSAGHGLNMQFGGHNMIMTCPLYSGEDYIQVIKRLDRGGQTHPVIINVLKTVGTVDEAIENKLNKKIDTQAQFLKYFQNKINS